MSSILPSGMQHEAVVYSPTDRKSETQTQTSAQFPESGVRCADHALHRVSEVRRQQGVSLRTVARHLKQDLATIRNQEKETTDLRLTELSAWQRVLDVPLVDLLVDSGSPLSRPVMERAQLVRVMKTAASIAEKSDSVELDRLARMLIDQLVQMMPELSEVSPWHSVGQRRSLDEVGRIVERRLRDDFFHTSRDE